MKRVPTILLTALFLFSFFSLSWSIDRETLRDMMNSPESTGGMRKMEAAAWPNLGLVEEILLFSDMTEDNSTARNNAIAILSRSAEEGVHYTPEKFFNIIMRLYSQASSVVHPRRLENAKRMMIGYMASFGDQFPLATKFSSFSGLASSLSSSGLIKNQGILTSLTQKILNAKEVLEKKLPNAKNTAISKIQAAVSELDAQRGKGVSEDGYLLLSTYCKNLINKIQSTN